MLKVSLGIMAYNEEANIGRLLSTVLDQKFDRDELTEVFVVASGCTDGTVEIVKAFAKQDRRIKLLSQDQREGKASAINLFLAKASGDIISSKAGIQFPNRRLCSA